MGLTVEEHFAPVVQNEYSLEQAIPVQPGSSYATVENEVI